MDEQSSLNAERISTGSRDGGSKQGIAERFNAQSAAFMQTLLQAGIAQMVEGEAMSGGLFANFAEIHVQDSTSISLPEALREAWAGCNKRGVGSAGVDWELVRGRLSGIQLSAAKQHDQSASLAHAALAADSLQIRDLGYFNLKHFAQQIEGGSYFLSRLKASARLYRMDGQTLEWVKLLHSCPTDQLDMPVLLGTQRIPCRFLAWRVPEPVARQALQETADDHCRPVSPARWQSAQWSIYITNAPPELLTLPQAQVLAKVRWQIELLFKRWKSAGLLDEWRSAKHWRCLTECFAKLLALLIQHWCCLLALWHLPERSLHPAAQLLRKHALHLPAVFADYTQLTHALSIICQALPACKMTASRKRPHTFQLILRASLA